MSNDERDWAGEDIVPPSPDPDDSGSGDDGSPDDTRRRRLLIYGGVAALGATGVAGAWFGTRDDDPAPANTPTATATPTESDPDSPTETPAAAVPALVRRHAPDLYFGQLETWFPTDPRQYLPDSDPEDPEPLEGVPALEGYAADARASGTPPHPTVFYHEVTVTDDVDAIQYWLYSAFDQFTVNFHWHDWELLQVFVDTETGEPLLFSASSHSRQVPNNEVLEPDLPDDRRPGILSEVGSHSSATDVNEQVPSFERLPEGVDRSDVTNDLVEVASGARVPFAYGLPRGEGARLPFVMPELDGHRLDRHPDLDLERTDFVDQSVTVTDWMGIPRPPDRIPLRQPGLVMTHPESPTSSDVAYTLEPIGSVREVISEFPGRQLSFQFTIPGFVEDTVAGHITDVGIPWEQDRFDDPLSDVTDPRHRAALDGASPSGLTDRVVGQVRQLRAGSDGDIDRVPSGSQDALSEVIPVSFVPPGVELAARLASPDPAATVTNGGRFMFLHVEAGDHRLVVNGPGYAPLAERFGHAGGLVRAGADGDVSVVAREDAVRIRGDGRDSTGIARVTVVEDFAGTLYDGRPPQPDRFAIPVHRDGSYTVTIVDADGRRGRYRFTPDDLDDGEYDPIERTETGKLQLLRSLREELGDLRNLAAALRDPDPTATQREQEPVTRRIGRAIEDVDGAIAAAEEGEAAAANERITAAIADLEDAIDSLQGEGGLAYSDAAVTVLGRRLRTAIARAETARATELA